MERYQSILEKVKDPYYIIDDWMEDAFQVLFGLDEDTKHKEIVGKIENID